MDRYEFRVSLDGKEIALYFEKPTQSDLFSIDLEYRRIFAEAVRQGVMTEAEAIRVYRKSGDWTKESDEQLTRLAFQISQLELVLENANDEDDDKNIEIVNKLSKIRAQQIEMIKQKIELFQQTAEAIANEQRMHRLVELCCKKVDGDERFFNNHESYEKFVQTNPDELSLIYKEAFNFEYKISRSTDDISSDWAEVVYLKKMHEKEKAKEQAKQKASTKKNKRKSVSATKGK